MIQSVRLSKRFFRISALLIAILIVTTSYHLIHAQAQLGTNAVVQVYDASHQTFSLHTFAPGNPTDSQLTSLGAYQLGAVSPDGTRFVAYLPLAGTTAPIVSGKVGAPAVPLAVPSGANVVSANFSHDGRYLFYTFTTEQGWTLGIVALADNKIIELTGTPQPPQGDTFSAVPIALAFDNTSSKLYITNAAFGGGALGLYAIDMSKINLSQAGRYPVPAITTVVKAGVAYSAGHFNVSPDNNKILFLAHSVVSPNAQPAAEGQPAGADALGLVDMNSGQLQTIVGTSDKQVLIDAAWLADSHRVIYAAGTAGANGQLPTSTHGFYTLDLSANQIIEGNSLPAPASIYSLTACADSVFFLTVKTGTQSLNQTLYSAPLNNLKAWSAPLFQGNTLQLLPVCVPGTASNSNQSTVPTLVQSVVIVTQAPGTTQGVTATVISATGQLNIRTGPGTNYPAIGHLNTGDTTTLVGRNDTSSWFVVLQGSQRGWISGDPQLITVTSVASTLPVITAPPAPPPTAGSAASINITVGGKAIIDGANLPLMAAPVEMSAGPNAPQPIAMLASGTVVDVVGGPALAWNTRWWQIRTSSGTGWVFERAGDAPGGALLLLPYISAPKPSGAAGLFVGGKAQVAANISLPMLAQPSPNGPNSLPTVGMLQGGEIVDVIAGPTASWNTRWWQVRTSTGVTGWVFERAGDAPGGSDLLKVYP